MSNKTILFLGGGLFQVPIIEKALKMNLNVLVVDRDEDALAFKIPGVIKVVSSVKDFAYLLTIAKKYSIDGVLTGGGDSSVVTVAKIASALNLPGITEEAALMSTNKSLMREQLKKHNVPVPLFYHVHNEEEFLNIVHKFDDKFVIKAPDNAGSRGIEMVRTNYSKEQLLEAFRYCLSFSSTGEVLCEEYMDGEEIIVDGLNFNGVCYPIQTTDQLRKLPPYFTDSGYNQPSLMDEETHKKAIDVAIQTCHALGMTTGSFNVEMILTKDGPKVVEAGARLGGDYITTHLVLYSTGVDLSEAIINIALGEKPDMKIKFNKPVASRFFMKETIGKIKSIEGVKDAEKVKGIKDVVIIKRVGEDAKPLRSSSDRLAVVMGQNDTVQESIQACEEAINKIKFIVE